LHHETEQHARHNFVVNVADAGFFGMAIGFASRVSVLPLFIASLGGSTAMIGLIGALQDIGWQLPQLLTSHYAAGLRHYKRATMLFTLHERLPFVGLVIVTALLPILGPQLTLVLTMLLLSWQALGGGFTATVWQMMISHIIPANRRGTFYGAQSSASALMGSVSVVFAGLILANLPSPANYALCFALAAVAMGLSAYFLNKTRETAVAVVSQQPVQKGSFTLQLRRILSRDVNVRWFIFARILSQFAIMAISFYTIYAVRHFGVDEVTIGLMAGVLTITQMVAAPLLGRMGDVWGHRRAFSVGMAAATASAFIVGVAPHANWLYLAFALAGVANSVIWSTVMAFTCEFGTLEERPYYIGLTNTLVAPATFLAPLIGAALADSLGFTTTFMLAAVAGIATIIVTMLVLRNPADCYVPVATTAAAD
jgi:MFS family permease